VEVATATGLMRATVCGIIWWMLAVLDTNVLVSGLCRFEGSATYEVVRSMGIHWDLAITPAVFLEYQDVLLRPGVRRLTGLSGKETERALRYIAMMGLQFSQSYLLRPNLLDESGNMFVECAVTSGADCLVTGNVRDFRQGELGPYGFEIIEPRRFLGKIPQGEE
jgi:predicted nucleic acid-binding protein